MITMMRISGIDDDDDAGHLQAGRRRARCGHEWRRGSRPSAAPTRAVSSSLLLPLLPPRAPAPALVADHGGQHARPRPNPARRRSRDALAVARRGGDSGDSSDSRGGTDDGIVGRVRLDHGGCTRAVAFAAAAPRRPCVPDIEEAAPVRAPRGRPARSPRLTAAAAVRCTGRFDAARNELVSDELGVAFAIIDGIPDLIPQHGRLVRGGAQ